MKKNRLLSREDNNKDVFLEEFITNLKNQTASPKNEISFLRERIQKYKKMYSSNNTKKNKNLSTYQETQFCNNINQIPSAEKKYISINTTSSSQNKNKNVNINITSP